MDIADAPGLPVAACLARASTHEVTLAETVLDNLKNSLATQHTYDSDTLDDPLLKKHGVEMIAPHRRNRTKPQTQEGRKLRRYQRRWTVERLFA